MIIDKIKTGWSTGGRIVFGTNPYHFGKDWGEGDGEFTLDVLMQAGSVTTNQTPILETMASIGGVEDQSSRVKVLLSDGVRAINGNIAFDCNKSDLKNLIEYILNNRKKSMTIYIGTEDFNYYKITSCKWSSFRLSCGESAILHSEIDFMSNREPERETPSNSSFFNPLFKNSNIIPYWQTGLMNDNDVLNVSSWDLTVNQVVTPAYLNSQDFDLPGYFRIANWEFHIHGSMFLKKKIDPEEAYENKFNKVQLGVDENNEPIILSANEFVEISASASFGGMDDVGNYTYDLELVGIPSSSIDNAAKHEPFELTVS